MQSRIGKERLINHNYSLGIARAIEVWKIENRTNAIPDKIVKNIIKNFKLATKVAEQ